MDIIAVNYGKKSPCRFGSVLFPYNQQALPIADNKVDFPYPFSPTKIVTGESKKTSLVLFMIGKEKGY